MRSAESMARAATAALTGMAAIARTAPPALAKGAAAADSSSSQPVVKKKRHKKKKGVDDDVVPFDRASPGMEVDAAAAAVPAAVVAQPKAVAGPCPEPATLGTSASAPFYPAGSAVIISGLSSRKDLDGVIGLVITSTATADERVAVRLPSGEQVLVRLEKVRPSLFPAAFSQ